MRDKCENKTMWSENGALISGHNFIEIENTHEKQILKCEVCGYESVGFKKEV